MKKALMIIGLGALLATGVAFSVLPNDLAIEVEPGIFFIGNFLSNF
ncbi:MULTISPECIES: hypothetical protein [Bacillaceae]|nr:MULTISPECIES: hypothetical protein [Bacillaceae]MBU8790926.1 hypothetical protein [Oceanobacillus caeni]MED4473440.1 hypothetical protein [Oceanobacillus caeni]